MAADNFLENHWRWPRRWNPRAQEAIDWACQQFPAEIRQRGLARAYYEFLWIMDEMLKILPKDLGNLYALDIGCGAGVLPLALTHLGARVTGLDRFVEYDESYDNQMGSIGDIVARFKANGICLHLQDFMVDGLPGPDETYDLVTAFAVIEHMHQSPKGMLGEMYRVLKPGGFIVLTTPNQAWIRNRIRLFLGKSVYHPLVDWWQTPFLGHVREYTLSEIKNMINWAGFEIKCATISSWLHASSRIRSPEGGPDRWTTRFTLHSFERWMVAASLFITLFVPSLRYSILIIGQKQERSVPL